MGRGPGREIGAMACEPIPNRRPNVTERIGPFAYSLSYHRPHCPHCGGQQDITPLELFFTMRGTIGHQMEDTLRQLGIAISRRMQGRGD
jgi:hypothetical protein